MLFNSYNFIFIFFPIVFFGAFFLGKHSHQFAILWLGLCSLAFYSIWDSHFLILLLASIVFNFSAGYYLGLLQAKNKARAFLFFAISANLVLLGYFKYANFFILLFDKLFNSNYHINPIILPLGISFFTFTQIAYLVDVYRKTSHEYNFIHYLLFVTYFPHLIAGPVLHHKQMMPQLAKRNTFRINPTNIAVGLTFFTFGLAKKLLLADSLADYASPVFNAANDGHMLMLFESWIGALAYSLQLYFDFSGYSDMAVGLSLMFNIRLPRNFDSPYKARNIIDFWRRWHITLSDFLRDYLYIPLGGNRKGQLRRYANLMTTMLLGGLWHGAGLTFVVWGGLHGLYIITNHLWHEIKVRMGWRKKNSKSVNLISMFLTFVAVTVAWVFFRADSFASARAILSGMSGINGISLPKSLTSELSFVAGVNSSTIRIIFDGLVPHKNFDALWALFYISLGLILVFISPNVQEILNKYNPTWENNVDVTNTQKSNIGRLASFMEWQPTAFYAIVTSILFFAMSFYNAEK